MAKVHGIEVLETIGFKAGPSHYVKSELDAYKLGYFYQNATQVIVNEATLLDPAGSYVVTVIN